MKPSLMGKNSYDGLVLNATHLIKPRLGSNWYTQTDITEVVIPLRIIVHPKLNVLSQLFQQLPRKFMYKITVLFIVI